MTGKRKTSWAAKHSFKKRKSNDGGGNSSKLEVGMVGVLVSHDRNREKSCRLDTFRLLNHFADKIYGPEKVEEKKTQESDNDCSDIESALSAEVTDIKGETKIKSHHQRRFCTVKSGCNNLIFVRFKEVMPGVLMRHIVQNLSSQDSAESQAPLVRNVLRVHPVEFTCPAYLDNMCKNIPPILVKKFSELPETNTKEYTIDYKCRNNSHLSRQTVLDGLLEAMKNSSSDWKYNCRSQSVSVIIDVLKTVCLVSVVKDYFKYRKYNVRELVQRCATKDHSVNQLPDGVVQDPKTNKDIIAETDKTEEKVMDKPTKEDTTDIADKECSNGISKGDDRTAQSSVTDQQKNNTITVKDIRQDFSSPTLQGKCLSDAVKEDCGDNGSMVEQGNKEQNAAVERDDEDTTSQLPDAVK